MFTYTKKDLPKSTIEIIVDIKKELVKKEEDKAFQKLLANLEIEGFRKGKVPADLGKKHIDKEHLYKEAIQSMIPQIYDDISKKEGFRAIINPKIELVNAKEGEDWKVKFTVALKPEIVLPDLKKIVSEARGNTKKEDIWVPGKEVKQEDQANDEQKKQRALNKILEALISKSKVEVPDLVIESELEHRLSGLLDEVHKIGLTVDGYLKSKNTTMDDLKTRFRQEINESYKVEFLLNEIADKNSIQVEQADLDKIFTNIKDEKERESAKQNAYFYASIIRKQKTLEYLLNL